MKHQDVITAQSITTRRRPSTAGQPAGPWYCVWETRFSDGSVVVSKDYHTRTRFHEVRYNLFANGTTCEWRDACRVNGL